MVTLPTLGQAVELVLDNLIAQYLAAIERWWIDVKASLDSLIEAISRFPPNPLNAMREFARHLSFLPVRFLKLLDDLLTSPIAAAYASMLDIAITVVPREWNTQVLTKRKAWIDATEAIINGAREAGNLQLPLSGRLYLLIARIKAIVALRTPTLGIIARYTFGTIASVILKLIDLLLRTFAVMAVIVCVMIFWRFAKAVVAGKRLVTFQQATPRIKWHAHRGTTMGKHNVIRRRDPGGNPP